MIIAICILVLAVTTVLCHAYAEALRKKQPFDSEVYFYRAFEE